MTHEELIVWLETQGFPLSDKQAYESYSSAVMLMSSHHAIRLIPMLKLMFGERITEKLYMTSVGPTLANESRRYFIVWKPKGKEYKLKGTHKIQMDELLNYFNGEDRRK